MFKKISSPEPVVNYLVETLGKGLRGGQKILWLVPGGSAIEIVVAVSKRLGQLDPEQLHNLTVTLTDERFGPEGHPDSNWQQLLQAGFKLPGAQLLPVVQGQPADKTAEQWQARLQEQFNAADYSLGFFGIGPDGHTSGILPHSPAVDSQDLVCEYDGGAFERITTTPIAIRQLNEAVVYAVGEPKWPVIEQLKTDKPLAEQPAQILKTVPKLTIFNDYCHD